LNFPLTVPPPSYIVHSTTVNNKSKRHTTQYIHSPGRLALAYRQTALTMKECNEPNIPWHHAGGLSDKQHAWLGSMTHEGTTCDKLPRCLHRCPLTVFFPSSSVAWACSRRNISFSSGLFPPSRQISNPHIPKR
jgi:hypothetical protein